MSQEVQMAGQRGFLWQTMDGEVLRLEDMKTGHIFNSMKMCFNHLAAAAGGRPVWFTKQYGEYQEAAMRDPRQLAWLVVFFIREIERRGDLPDKYKDPYRAIIRQLIPRLEADDVRMLTEGGE